MSVARGRRIAQPRSALAARMRERGFVLVSEAARAAGVRPATIYRWLDDGWLEGTNDGGARFVLRTSLRQRLEGREAGAVPQAPYPVRLGGPA